MVPWSRVCLAKGLCVLSCSPSPVVWDWLVDCITQAPCPLASCWVQPTGGSRRGSEAEEREVSVLLPCLRDVSLQVAVSPAMSLCL